MNERIKELAEQAGYLKDGFGFGHWDMPECKKFAELIVKECVNTCIMVGDSLWSEAHQSNLGTAQTCAVLIKKHFGVEE